MSLRTLAVLLFAVSSVRAEPPKGFTALFNDKDLAGWHGWAIHEKGAGPIDFAKLPAADQAKKVEGWTADAKKHWSVDKGELVNDGKGAYLATDADYGDIELLIEYKTVAGADSGIYLRGTPQVQIWDSNQKFDPKNPNRKPHLGSGGLFNNTPGTPGRDPLVLADKPFGQWNQFRIVQVGERTWVWLNGKAVVEGARMENYWDRKKPLPKTGPILLQTHGGEIRWRNLFVREIASAEATDWLGKVAGDGFKPAFNGKDFTGWAGPVENYDIVDGTIICKPKKGGFIFTTEEYADFVATLEYKVPPGGNNGLAIRFPGTGRPSVDAMCEIQVLDDEHPKYAKLDVRQFNGSAYGLAAAHRGFARPVGDWNYEQVTVKGTTIQVELNGTLILDADLGKVTVAKNPEQHPGRVPAKGHFGLCGHNDPVAFRNVKIKTLP
ncbi:MAG: DUF1080 domain-containing protein [Planctomycetia bacterium]|nr:DUF1080 domain-containing protein [Planctomycetia bacterium]